MSLRARSDDRSSQSFEETIGQLHRTKGHDIGPIVSGFSAEQRARLALFCFSRAHMREIGVAIAATCELDVLSEIGAAAGAALFSISRERPVLEKGPSHGRPKVSLAQAKPCATPFEDAEPDLDTEASGPAPALREFEYERENETVAA